MYNQSEREKLISRTNYLIEQNNASINAIKGRIDSTSNEDQKKKLLHEIDSLENDNDKLALRLGEPLQSMIVELKELRSQYEKEKNANKRSEILNQIDTLNDQIMSEEVGRDRNIGRFNKG